MFIDEVYRVSWGSKKGIEHKGKTIEVTPIIEKECRMITRVHSVLIGVAVIFSYTLSEYLYVDSFFDLLLLIVLVLALLTAIVNYLSKYLIMKKADEHV